MESHPPRRAPDSAGYSENTPGFEEDTPVYHEKGRIPAPSLEPQFPPPPGSSSRHNPLHVHFSDPPAPPPPSSNGGRWDRFQSHSRNHPRQPLVSTRWSSSPSGRSSAAAGPGHKSRLPATSPHPHSRPAAQKPSREGSTDGEAESDYLFTDSGSDSGVFRRVDIVYDPSQAAKDLTIRLDLEVEEDWGPDFEAFCRLRRLGRFKEAKQHFKARLQHLSTIPYLWVQYTDMLQAAGDYKAVQHMPPLPELHWDPECNRGPFTRQYESLYPNINAVRLLERSPPPEAEVFQSADEIVQRVIFYLQHNTFAGSTKIQCFARHLDLLQYIDHCTDGEFVATQARRVKTGHAPDWKGMYTDLVNEQGIWDFRDLFLSSIAFYGERRTFLQFFGSDYPLEVVDAIVKDWSPADDDEVSTMAMLDLFSSWILEKPALHPLRRLLFDHARALAASVERIDPGLMMSGPFIRWLLAKTTLEMLDAVLQRQNGLTLEDFGGLEVRQVQRMHLPVYVPTRHTKRPPWEFFFSRSTPEQRRVVEVAAGAAEALGDYSLQAEALKLLILQSEDPRDLMDTLAHLQLEIQGDKEGYIATCLSKYLVITDTAEEAELLLKLEKPGVGAGTFDFENCHNASLVWAWSAIRIMLRCSSMEGESGTHASFVAQFAEKGIRMNEWKIPPYIVDFSQQELGIGIHGSTRTASSPSGAYGRNTVTQPGAGPRARRMGPRSGHAAAMPPEQPPLPPRSHWPPPPPPPRHIASHSQTLTAPPPHGNRHQDRLGGSNTGGSSVQMQHRHSSRESVREWRCLEDVNTEGEKNQAASTMRDEKTKAGQEQREEAKVTWEDDAQPSQGRGRGTLWDWAGATESQSSRRKEEGEKTRLDRMAGNDDTPDTQNGRNTTLGDQPALQSSEPKDITSTASTEQQNRPGTENSNPLNNTNTVTTKSKDIGGRKTTKWKPPMPPRRGPVYRHGPDPDGFDFEARRRGAESQFCEEEGYSSSSSASSPSLSCLLPSRYEDGPTIEEVD